MVKTLRTLWAGLLLLGLAASAHAHGLVQDPPARNWFCGAITKPDHVPNGTAQYPVCGDAFSAPGIDFTAGYSFMSVLTHTQGRAVLGPRTNVCGFNSETWNGAATVWDQPINWPTTNITAGPRTFTWNISWGPHFSDTEEFRYWITKPGFQFQVGRALSFSDFEDTAFCILPYSDANPTGNPNVTANPGSATFQTRCTVPQRSGRHVIYAEWGRNFFTFERFHGCIDVVFQGTTPTVDAQIALNPNVTEFTGGGTIGLDGRSSVGSNLSYQWSVDSQNPDLYSITNANQSQATLNLDSPQATGNVTVSLVVTSGNASDSATRTIVHRPAVASQWFDLGPVTSEPRTFVAGDRVSVRTVLQNGQDVFWPPSPLVITAATTASNAWPLALGQAVNAQNGNVRIGVLNAQNQVVPMQDALANRIFALTTAGVASAFLQIQPGAVPPAPTSLTATAGNAQVQLSWGASAGATSYNVKRSTTSGGPYTTVSTGMAATSFTNTGLTNGTPYFFVVTAFNASGESANSNQVGATPQTTPANFTLSASPASLSVSGGASASSTLTIGRTSFTGAVALTATGLPSGVTAAFNPPSTTGGSSIVTFAAAAGAAAATASVTITGTGGGLTRTATIALSVTGGGGAGGVTVTRAVTSTSPWFNEQVVRINNTGTLTALTVTIVVQRTTGISFSGQYNTVGGQIQQSNGSTTAAVTYTFTLAPGQSLGAGNNRTFAAQSRGTGTAHPTTGDTYTVTYTTGGVTTTQTGGF